MCVTFSFILIFIVNPTDFLAGWHAIFLTVFLLSKMNRKYMQIATTEPIYEELERFIWLQIYFQIY